MNTQKNAAQKFMPNRRLWLNLRCLPHYRARSRITGIVQGHPRCLDEADNSKDYTVYVNAHGTGTPLNDAAETLSIKKAFGKDIERVLVSSTKSMTGHMLCAAGAVEAIVAVLALQNGIIPPTVGLTQPDPVCDLDYVPLTARKADVGLALSVSLGFGGHNACLAFAKP
jgi:3-oxoacyl-[acyl-carrier-protein] synthase II